MRSGRAGLLLRLPYLLSRNAAVRTGRCLPPLVSACMVASVAPSVVLQTLAPWYLLASSVLLVVGLAAWIAARDIPFAGQRRLVAAVLALLAIIAPEVRHVRFQSADTGSDVEAELRSLIRALHDADVQALYSMSGPLQRQIMMYSRESIAPRHRSPRDRREKYVHRVDAARAAGAHTALVGLLSNTGPFPAEPKTRLVPLGTDYFMIVDPAPELPRARGFVLPSPQG